MDKKIIFKARNRAESILHPRPFPASQAVPQWWREETPYEKSWDNPDGKKVKLYKRIANATHKKCTPMLDALTTGYIVSLWADVMVEQTDDFPLITWKVVDDVFQIHGPSSRRIPAPEGYDQVVFKYLNTWIPITPPGYSVLITSPFGYRDLPFHAVPAVIDSDRSTLELVFPMWIKTGFEGIVEKGTPLIQITPFKRDNWKAEFEYFENNDFWISQQKNFESTIVNHYIKNHWSKKNYK